MNQTIIISPSGNFYGSEQVLFDYINSTNIPFQIFVPKNSIFEKKLLKEKKWDVNSIHSFLGVKKLYLKIFCKLFFLPIESVYLNEAGHIRYIKILAKIFKKVKFIIHIRLVEDTKRKLISSNNIKFLVVSKFIQKETIVISDLIYDPYPFTESNIVATLKSKINIGIIGRITKSKGLDKLVVFLKYLEKFNESEEFKFLLYGDIINNDENLEYINYLENNKSVQIMGFTSDKFEMYSQIDIVMHLCENEPLGRIYLEAIDFQIPLIGFLGGGIGEIGIVTKNTKLLIPFDSNWVPRLYEILIETKKNLNNVILDLSTSKIEAKKIFSIENYTSKLDNIISK